ncbi:MAG: mycofactocin biosynthesis glycosyltransferase MftF [Nocardioidaceae bacterium]
MTDALPHGFTVRISDGVRTRGDGTLLLGGTPPRVLRLTSAADGLLDHGRVVVDGPRSQALADHLLAAGLAVPVLTDTAANLDDVTVVVPVRDRTDDVRRLLCELAPHVRCLVVDDASRDGPGLARVVRGLGADYVRLDTNVGPAGARNAGLARTGTEYVAFVDSDVMVAPTDLRRLRRHFADPRAAVVAPRVRGRSASPEARWFERYDATVSSLDLGSRSSLVRPGGPVAFVPAACLVARAACLRSGFDEAMRVGEDVDLVWRLDGQGWRVRYDADVVVGHRTPESARTWLQRKVLYGTSAAPLAMRHGDAVAPAAFTPSGALVVLAILFRGRLSACAAAIAVAWHTVGLRRSLPATRDRSRLTAELTLEGMVASVMQTSSLLLRHWSPVVLPAALVSRRVRRVVGAALAVDLVSSSPARPRMLRPSDVLARRLDDVAYGAGVWLGALRARSAACLPPRLVTRPRRTRPEGAESGSLDGG